MANEILSLTIILLFTFNYTAIFVNGECGSEIADLSNNTFDDWTMLLLNESCCCFINECTIRIKESNVLLNIINKTADWIIATNTTNLFTIPVASNNSVAYCSQEDENKASYFTFYAVVTSIIVISSTLNIVLHFLVKELRSTPGYVIIGICGTIIIVYLCTMILSVFQYLHRVNGNTVICAAFKYMTACFTIVYTMLKATYLYHFAYLMYRTYISRPYEEKTKRLLYIYGVVNVIVSTMLSVLIITLDQIRFRNVFDTYNGYCTSHFFNEVGTSDYLYNNYIYALSLLSILTAIGIIFFIIGLTLYFLTTKHCCACSGKTGPNNFRVSITLTSATALGVLILVVLLFAGFNEEGSVMAASIGVCVEQVILLTVFLTSTKTRRKLKKYFHRTEIITRSKHIRQLSIKELANYMAV